MKHMTTGEVIALLAKYSSDEDWLLMSKAIDRIEVQEHGIMVYTTDYNTPDIFISEET